MTQTTSLTDISDKKRSLPIAGQAAPATDTLDIDAELRAFEQAERARLGIETPDQWLEEMADLTFTKSERSKITMLIGGLTVAHDYIVSGGLKNAGYEVVALDAPDYESLRAGQEFGNRGQCNPTYFTVGNLVKVLIYFLDKKCRSTAEIIDRYVFLSAGAC